MKDDYVAERIEQQIDKDNMADEEALQECPICGEASEGAMDCGCAVDLHSGKI